jgi:hypothetical protein
LLTAPLGALAVDLATGLLRRITYHRNERLEGRYTAIQASRPPAFRARELPFVSQRLGSRRGRHGGKDAVAWLMMAMGLRFKAWRGAGRRVCRLLRQLAVAAVSP